MGLYNKKWKPTRIFVAGMLLLASLIPLFGEQSASAAAITERSIQMSSSANAATDVTYQVTFDTATTSNIGGLVIDFCANSPIIEVTCTLPASFDANTAGLALANQSGITDFAVDNTGTADDSNTIVLTRTAASVSSGTTVTFDLGAAGGSDGITNPANTNTTFYARIITFSTNAGAQGYTSTDIDAGGAGTDVDAGGLALSTAEQIIVTARVPERLTFCVYVDSDGTPPTSGENDCDSKSGSAISLGDDNGALHPEGEFINKYAFFGISTNAGGCVGGSNCTVVNMKGSTLTSGSNTITAVPNGGGEGTISAEGTEQFGMCLYELQGTGLTPDTLYDGNDGVNGDCSALNHNSGTATTGQAVDGITEFGFDTTSTESTYGDQIAVKDTGDFSTASMAFVGNIGEGTEAGIYASTLTFIATGTY